MKRRKVDAVPFESIPIANALRKCRPNGYNDGEWKELCDHSLSVLRGKPFFVVNVAQWAALSPTSKEQMIKQASKQARSSHPRGVG